MARSKEAGLITQTRMVNRVTGQFEGIYYGWQGATDIVRVSGRWVPEGLKHGEVFWMGPFRLIALSCEMVEFEWYCRRWRGPWTRLLYLAYRATRWLDLCYRRLIITAAVWNLADYTQSAIPSWRDLDIVKHFGRR